MIGDYYISELIIFALLFVGVSWLCTDRFHGMFKSMISVGIVTGIGLAIAYVIGAAQ